MVDDLRLLELAARLNANGPDGRAGIRALLREIETRYPGEIERMTASLQLAAVGVRA